MWGLRKYQRNEWKDPAWSLGSACFVFKLDLCSFQTYVKVEVVIVIRVIGYLGCVIANVAVLECLASSYQHLVIRKFYI